MRIAVSADQQYVATRLSECEGFRVYEFEGDTIHVHDYFENDTALLERFAETLETMGISTVITNQIDQDLLEELENKGLWVFNGIKGEISEAILKLKQGMLIAEEDCDPSLLTGGCGGSSNESEHVCCGKHDHSAGEGCGSHGKSKSGGCSCL